MSDARVSLKNNVLIEEDLIGTAYTISDMMIISLAYHDIVDKPEEKEHAKNIIRSLVTEWLELVAPIKYVPGLVELTRLRTSYGIQSLMKNSSRE